MKKLLLISLLANSMWLKAQPELVIQNAQPFAESISAEQLKKHVFQLASPEFEGRDTGTEGQRKAGNYLVEQFKLAGLQPFAQAPDYIQAYPLYSDSILASRILINQKAYWHGVDFICPANGNLTDSLNFSNPVFVGYGLKDSTRNDYDWRDVSGKVLVMFSGLPAGYGKELTPRELRGYYRKKIQWAREAGARAVLFLPDNKGITAKDLLQRYSVSELTPAVEKPVMSANRCNYAFLSGAMAQAMVGKEVFKKFVSYTSLNSIPHPAKLKIKGNFYYLRQSKMLYATNVLGYVPGSEFPEEYVLVTAHYDHLGKGLNGHFPGADDNASGTAMVLELARQFAQARTNGKGPRRSVVFMAVSGEEKGLFGSSYYVEHPVFPLSKLVVNINSDMVGRSDSSHAEPYLYVIGDDRKTMQLRQLSERVNQQCCKLTLDYRYNAPNEPQNLFMRSDHYNFAKNGIPVIFYFDGIHADYHRTTDTPERINYQLLRTRAQLVFYTAWQLANQTIRLN